MKNLFFKFSALAPVLLIFSFFLPNLFLGKIPIPADSLLGLYHPFRDESQEGYNPGRFPTKNPLITDPVLQTYPWRKLTIKNIKNGKLPLWNPYSFAGQPLLANSQSAPFTVLNLLFFILPFNLAWAAAVLLPPLLLGLFMYLFLREINLSKTAAAFGAFVLPFSGFFVAWMTWGTITSTAMWLPLILLSIEKLAKKISPVWFLILIFSISQTIFGGHLQTALYVFAASIFYLFFKFAKTSNRKFLAISLAAIVLGVLLSAVQLLPTLEFLNQSARSTDQGYSPGRADWFIPYQHLIQLIAPDFFGNPATYNYWGVWNYAEFVSFIGIIPLGLVLLAAKVANHQRNFFLALFFISLFLATANPIAKIPFTFGFPLVSSMQPSRIIFLIVFSLAALASFGLDYFLNLKAKAKIVFLPAIILIALLTLLALIFSQQDLFQKTLNLDPRFIAARNLLVPITFASALVIILFLKFSNLPKLFLILAIFALTAVELFRFGHKFTPFAKLSWIFPQTKITNYLSKQQKPFRIMTTDRRIMHPNISSVYGIESVDGYDPLYLKDYAKFVTVLASGNAYAPPSSFNRIVTPQNYSSNLASLLNVGYLLSFDTINQKNWELVQTEGETKVYKNRASLKRAFFVDEVIKTSSPEEEYSKLLDPSLDLAQTAASGELSFPKVTKDSNLTITEYSDQGMTLSTQSEIRRPLVVTNVNYPGWEATVDDQRTQIYKTNAIFQLIEVPEGQHLVEFKFKPQSFYNGLYISSFALLLSLAGAILVWRKKYQ